jgi:hypothetical protein
VPYENRQIDTEGFAESLRDEQRDADFTPFNARDEVR